MADGGLFHAQAFLVDELLEDEMMAAAAVIADRNEFLRNREALQRRKKPQKQPALTVDYVEVVVPGYSDAVFKSHFRMQRTSFEVSAAQMRAVGARREFGLNLTRRQLFMYAVTIKFYINRYCC